MIASIFLLPNGTFFIELVTVVVILLLMTKYILPPLTRRWRPVKRRFASHWQRPMPAKAEAAAAGDERQHLLATGEGPGS